MDNSETYKSGQETVSRSSAKLLGAMLSTDRFLTKESEFENDDFTVKDLNYSVRVFTDLSEKTSFMAQVSTVSKKTGWVGAMASFTDPSAWQTELSAFVNTTKGRAAQEGDQVTVNDLKNVYQYKSDGTWFLFASYKDGVTKQSELINDDYTVKDANYSARVFADAAEKTGTLNQIDALEKKTYFVGTMLNFTDPTAYQTELSDFVNATLSRVAQQGDQVSVTNLKRIYQYDGTSWSVFASSSEASKKESEFINDDNTVKDADYADRVFADLTEKTATLTQVDTNKDDIVDLQDEDVILQSQITLLQKKSYWVGSFANFTDPSAYEAELTAFVTTKMSRAPQEGDQVSVLDRAEVYQYSSAGDWQVFSSGLTIAKASKTETGIVKVGDGVDVDSDGVISVNIEPEALDIKMESSLTSLDDWVDEVANVPLAQSVSLYCDVAGGGILTPAIYRVNKIDADNVVIDAYEISTGKYYRKIKNTGTWDSSMTEIVGGVVAWGSITGTQNDQADLQTALDGKISTSQIADNLTTTDPASVLSARQGKILSENKISASQIADNLTTDDATKVLSARQGKILNESKIEKSKIVNNLTTDDATSVLSAYQGKVLNGKFTDGSVRKIGSATIGGTLQGIYLKNGSPCPCVQLYKNKAIINDNTIYLLGESSMSNMVCYAPITAGTKGQVLISNGSSVPQWGYLVLTANMSIRFQAYLLSSTQITSGLLTLRESYMNYPILIITAVNTKDISSTNVYKQFVYRTKYGTSSSSKYTHYDGNNTGSYITFYFPSYTTMNVSCNRMQVLQVLGLTTKVTSATVDVTIQ